MAHRLKSSKSLKTDKEDIGKETIRSSPTRSMTQKKGILSKFTKKRAMGHDEGRESYDDSYLEESGKKKHKRKHQPQGSFNHLYTYITKAPVSLNTYDYLRVFPILDILPINRPSLVFLNSLHFETLLELSKTFCSTFSSSSSLHLSSSSPSQNLSSSSPSLPSSSSPSCSSTPLSCSSPSPSLSSTPATSTTPPPSIQITTSSPNGRSHKFAAPISSSLTSRVSNLSSVPHLSDSRIHGGSIATYPKLCLTPTLGGGGGGEGGGGGGGGGGAEHIIADSWMSLSFSNRVYFGISDGIGHGYESQKSAISGLLGLLSHLVFSHFSDDGEGGEKGSGKGGKEEGGNQPELVLQIDGNDLLSNQQEGGGQEGEEKVSLFEGQKRFNIPQALKSVVESFQVAQTLIINTTDEMTALTAGMLVEIAATCPNGGSSGSPSPSSSSSSSSSSSPSSSCFKWDWAFVGASLGDCKVYRYSRATEQVLEVTSDDQTKISLRDAGGHLGKECLLDNLTCYFCPLDEGDFIICLTDGVHDNLDPETLRIPPSSLGIDADSWRHVATVEGVNARRKFREMRMSQVLGLNHLNNKSVGLTPEMITERVLDYVKETTEDLRGGEEKGAVLQRDWEILDGEERMKMKSEVIWAQKNAPGKYDHSTCLVIEVQRHPDGEKEVDKESQQPSVSGSGSRSRSSIFLGKEEKETVKEKEKEEEEEKEKEKEKEKGKGKENPKRHKKAKSSGSMGRVLKGAL